MGMAPPPCRALAGLLPLLLPAAAAAWDEGLDDTEALFFGEETVTVATRTPEPLHTAPSVATVVTRATIRERGLQTLAELLATLPGFYVQPDERRLHVLSRGLSDGVLVLVDGVPRLSDADRLDVLVDHRLDLTHVARVEVLRGPGTSLWGPGALAGVVNVVTLDGSDVPGLQAEVGAGSFSDRLVRLRAGGRVGDADLLLTAGGRALRGPPLALSKAPTRFVRTPTGWKPTTFSDVTGDNAGERYLETLAKVRLGPVTVLAGYDDYLATGQLSSFSHAPLAEGDNERRGGRDLFSQVHGDLVLPRWHLSGTAFVRRQARRDRLALLSRAAGHPYGGAIPIHSLVWHTGGVVQADLDLDRHRFTLGAQGHFNATEVDAELIDPQSGKTRPGVSRDAASFVQSAFLQYRTSPWRSLHLTAGVSVDKHTDFSLAVNPRLAVVHRPTPWLLAKLLYGEAVRTPNQFDVMEIARDTAREEVVGASSNPDLRPEKVRTGELVVRAQGASLWAEGVAYASRATDLVQTVVTDGVARAVNAGGRDVLGTEWSAGASLYELLEARLALSVLRAWDPGGRRLLEMPERLVHLGVTARPVAWLSADLRGTWVSERADEADLGPFVRVDSALRLGGEPLRLSILVQNLLGTEVWHDNPDPGRPGVRVLLPGAPRTALFLLSGAL